MCAVAACVWALLRLIERPDRGKCALFGVVIGLGVLTVTAGWMSLGALRVAACLQPSIRGPLRRPDIAFAIGIAALIAAPHFIWLAMTPEGIAAILPSLKSGNLADHARFAFAGVRRAFTEPLMYLSPLIFLYPIFFPAMLTTIWHGTRLRPNAEGEPDYEQLILHMTLLNIAALIIGAVVFGIYRYPTHALMPLFLVSSIWLTAQARRAAKNQGQVRRFVIMAVSVAVFAFFARLANMYVLEPVCTICRWGVPYAELADEMKAQGFSSDRIIVTNRELGGNLHRFFGDAQIALAGRQAYAPPPAPTTAAKTALVWPADESDERAARKFRAFQPKLTAGDLAGSTTIRIPWRGHIWKPDGYRQSVWRLLILESPPRR
jgi:4-amino-4-deoxy-L-arabinose transferase-like glycosyltransferase